MDRPYGATRKDGTICRGRALPGETKCWTHSDQLRESRAGDQREGGTNRSNARRAAAKLPPDLRSVLDGLVESFEAARAGDLPKGRAQELAALAGAICRTVEVAQLDGELAAIRAELDAVRDRTS